MFYILKIWRNSRQEKNSDLSKNVPLRYDRRWAIFAYTHPRKNKSLLQMGY